MSESNRFNGCTDWIELEVGERERTPHEIVETGMQLHLAGLSLSDIKHILEGWASVEPGQRSTAGFERPIYSLLTERA